MNCKYCNAELEKDAVYCPKCGKRIDGKKRCNHCGRDINETSVYCTYCGARTDGKSACPKCGEAFTGNFCPKCGTPAQAEIPHPVAASRDREKTMRILAVTKQSALYGALCILFIFSFFITFSLVTTVEVVSLRTDINSTSFYFLITQFQEISDFLAEKSYYPEMSLALYLDAGISAACIAAIIIICATYFAIGTTAFVKSMRAKKEIAMSKYVLMPALLTLALTLFLYSLASLSIAQEGAKAKLTLGATTIVNIVLVSIAFATAAILQIIIDTKKHKKTILNYVLNAAGMLLAVLFIATLTTNLLSVDSRSNQFSVSGSMSAPLLLIGLLAEMGTIDNPATMEVLIGMITNSTIIFILFILTFAAGTLALIAFAKGALNNKSTPRILSCVFSAISAALSIAYLIMSIIFCTENLAGAATVGASPICAIIFSIFALTLSIVNCILLRNRDEQGSVVSSFQSDPPAQNAE